MEKVMVRAIEEVDEKGLLYAIENAADIEAEINESCMRPLHYAVILKRRKLAEILIQKGANIDVQDDEQITPLHYAVWNNCYRIVEMLIKKGANVNVVEKNGYAPLYNAVMYGKTDMAHLLFENGATILNSKETFHVYDYSMAYGNIEIAHMLRQLELSKLTLQQRCYIFCILNNIQIINVATYIQKECKEWLLLTQIDLEDVKKAKEIFQQTEPPVKIQRRN